MELWLRALIVIGTWAFVVFMFWVEYKLAMYVSNREGTADWYDAIVIWAFFGSIAILIIGAFYTIAEYIHFG